MTLRNFHPLEPEVSATDGYVIVRFAGEHEIHYVDRDKVLVFGREPLFSHGATIAYEVFPPPLPWRWTNSGTKSEIPVAEQPGILLAIRAGLESLGTRAVLPGEAL